MPETDRFGHEPALVARTCSPAKLLGFPKFVGTPRCSDARRCHPCAWRNQGSLANVARAVEKAQEAVATSKAAAATTEGESTAYSRFGIAWQAPADVRLALFRGRREDILQSRVRAKRRSAFCKRGQSMSASLQKRSKCCVAAK